MPSAKVDFSTKAAQVEKYVKRIRKIIKIRPTLPKLPFPITLRKSKSVGLALEGIEEKEGYLE